MTTAEPVTWEQLELFAIEADDEDQGEQDSDDDE